MKKMILGLFFTAFFMFGLQHQAQATSHYLAFNQTVSGVTTNDENQRYIVTAQENGQLTVTVTSSQDLKVLVFDKDGKAIYSYNQLAQDGTGTQTFKQMAYVDAGNYYIDVYPANSKQASFKVSSAFKGINSDENEPNDKQEQAQLLTSGQKLTGMMTYRDSEDWYRIDMSGSGILNLKLEAQTDIGYVIYNEKKQELVSRRELKGTASKKAAYTFDEFLDKGTYYVRLLKNDSTGIYTIQPNIEIIKHTEASDNNAKEWAQSLTPATKYFGTVTLTDENDWYKYEVTKKGKLTWTVDNDVKLTATGYEGANIISSSQVFGTSGYSKVQYVEPGTYYLHLAKTDNQVGRYTVKVDFSSIKDDELSANNNMQSAQFLSVPINPFRGSVTVQDSEDWFVFTLNKKQTINLRLLGNVYMGMSLYRSDKSAVFNILYVNDPVKNNSVAEYVGTLSKGTYYIQTKKMYELTGTYTLALNAGTKPTLSSVTKPKAGAKKVTGKATKGSIVTVKVGRKSYKTTANTSGKFTVTVPKLKKGAKLIVTAKNDFGTSAKKTVTVKK